jgi:hypothetical protein
LIAATNGTGRNQFWSPLARPSDDLKIDQRSQPTYLVVEDDQIMLHAR